MSFSHASQLKKPVLEATVHDVRHIAAIIRGVSFGHSQRVTVKIEPAGLTFTVDEGQTLLGSAYLPSSNFETFQYTPESSHEADPEDPEFDQTSFEIDLNAILTALDIFGTAGPSGSNYAGNGWKGNRGRRGGFGGGGRNEDAGDWDEAANNAWTPAESISHGKTGMRMVYEAAGHPLTMILSENTEGPVTICKIHTLEAEQNLDMPFHDDDKIIRVIMKSSWILEALSELDHSCEKLTIFCSPPNIPLPSASSSRKSLANAQPTFRLLGESSYGSTEMDYPNDRDVLESFECEEPVQFSYRFSQVTRTTRALQGSLKTSIRMNEEGILSLQFMMPAIKVKGRDSTNAFIEFRLMALVDNEDE